MPWTYDPNLINPSDKVRFKIGDTIEGAPLFDDQEVEAILAQNANDVLKTAIELMRSLVRRYARFTGTLKADDVSKDVRNLYKQYSQQLAELIEEQRAGVGTTRGGQLGGAYLREQELNRKTFC